MGAGEIRPAEQGAVHLDPAQIEARENPLQSDRLMKNSRGGLGDIPSPGKAGAPPASPRPRRAKARGPVRGPRSRPFRQRMIVVCRSLTSSSFTPKRKLRDDNAS